MGFFHDSYYAERERYRQLNLVDLNFNLTFVFRKSVTSDNFSE